MSETVLVLLIRNRLPISRMLGWNVFSAVKSSRYSYTRRSTAVRGCVIASSP
jgi:hypothetical protein